MHASEIRERVYKRQYRKTGGTGEVLEILVPGNGGIGWTNSLIVNILLGQHLMSKL